MERRSGFKLNRLIAWWDTVENKITRLLILLFILLIVIQGLLVNQDIKTFLCPTEKLEGKSVEDVRPAVKSGDVQLSIQGSGYIGNVDILVNGERVTSFYRSTAQITVRNDDIIEISGVKIKNMSMVQVTSVSGNVISPEPGRTLTINNNLVYLCRVKLR